MKIKHYKEGMEYVEQHRDEMLAFIISQNSPPDTPEALFERLAANCQILYGGETPDEHLWSLWLYYKDQFERMQQMRETAEILHQFTFGGTDAQAQQSTNS